MNAMTRTSLPHPSPLHLRVRFAEALARRGIEGSDVEEALTEACRIAASEHQAAKEAAQ